MKILIISDMVGGPGGANKTIEQIDEFMPPTIKIHILLDSVTREYTLKNYSFKSVNFIPISYKFHTDDDIKSSIDKQISTFKPDIVHVINGSIKSNLLIRKYLISKNIPFVVTESLIDSSLKLPDKLLDDIRSINTQTDYVIYVSKNNSLLAQKIFAIYPKQYIVIPNAVTPIINKKNIYNSKPNRFYTTARCVHQKGIDIIIRALSKINDRHIIFDVIGDGEKSLEYTKLAESLLGNRHDFNITGWQEKMDPSILAKYDLFISASREEGLSLSILEAATLGMPIICSNTSGNDELIEACNCGQIFKVDDFEALAKCIIDFTNNPTNLSKMAIEGSNKVDNLFNLQNNMKLIFSIYTKVLKS